MIAAKAGRALAAIFAVMCGLLTVGCDTEPDALFDSGAGEVMQSTDELQAREGPSIDVENHPGRNLYQANCAGCHEGGVPKAPNRVWLEMMAPDAILGALNDGIMRQQAAMLEPAERLQIAEYLTRTPLADYRPPEPPPACDAAHASFDRRRPPARILWGHDNSRFIPADVAGLSPRDVPNLQLKWAFAYPAAQRARSQPAIGWGAIFVGSQDGTVYAFDMETGCTRWTFRASAEIRTGIVADPDSERLFFGDVLARAYALDASTGELIWRLKVDDHPSATITGTPTLGGDRLFVPVSSLEVTSAADPDYACCTFRGQIVALDPATGSENWRVYTVPNPPARYGETSRGTGILGPSGAPVWSSPTYDRESNRLYFGSGENYSSPADGNSDAVFSVDAETGERIWVTQLTRNDAWNVGCMMGNENCPEERGPDLDVAASPILVRLANGGSMLVIGQKSGRAFGLDPATGQIRWQTELGHGGTQGGVHFGMAAEGQRVFVPINDMANTRDGRIYDAENRGAGIHAVDAETGEIMWRQFAVDRCGDRPYCDPGISAVATAIPGVVFAGHLDGRLRAYSSATGEIIWSVDTSRRVNTVTGVAASGGGMSGPGPVVSDGHLVLNSGYGLYYHMPGNLLMVFTVDGQ